MFRKHHIFSYLRYSIPAAIIYLVSVVLFLSMDNYTDAYILYLGNILFAVVIVFHVINFAKRRDSNANTRMAIMASAEATLLGVIISILSIFIILAIMEPSAYSDIIYTAKELSKPAPALEGNGHALLMILLFSAFLGNMGFGIFVSAMLPNMLKHDQTGETATINPKVS